MFGTSAFGKTPFGKKSVSDNLVYADLPFSSLRYIPPSLREEELYTGLTQVLDYVIQRYHHAEIQKISGLYDVFHPDFDPDFIIRLLGGSDFIVLPLSEDQKRSLCLILSNLYEIKGLRRGVEGILSSLGIPALLYESWEVDREVETGESSRKPRPDRYDVESVEPGGKIRLSSNESLSTGDEVYLLSNNGLPPETLADTVYYVIKPLPSDRKTIQLAHTRDGAFSRVNIPLSFGTYDGMKVRCGGRHGFDSAIWFEKIDRCGIAVVFDATGKLVTETIDESVKTAIESLLWVCSKLKSFLFVLDYRGPGREDWTVPPTESEVSFSSMTEFCDRFKIVGDNTWCLLYKPIIEDIATPNEEKTLAVFTEDTSWGDIGSIFARYESWNYGFFYPSDTGDYRWGFLWNSIGPNGNPTLQCELDEGEDYVSPPLFYFPTIFTDLEQETITSQVRFVLGIYVDRETTVSIGTVMNPELSSILESRYVEPYENDCKFFVLSRGYNEICTNTIDCSDDYPLLYLQQILENRVAYSGTIEIRDVRVYHKVFDTDNGEDFPFFINTKQYDTNFFTRKYTGFCSADFDPVSSTITIPKRVRESQSLVFPHVSLPVDLAGVFDGHFTAYDCSFSEGATTFGIKDSDGEVVSFESAIFDSHHSYEILFTDNEAADIEPNRDGFGWLKQRPNDAEKEYETFVFGADSITIQDVTKESLSYLFSKSSPVNAELESPFYFNAESNIPFVGEIDLSFDVDVEYGALYFALLKIGTTSADIEGVTVPTISLLSVFAFAPGISTFTLDRRQFLTGESLLMVLFPDAAVNNPLLLRDVTVDLEANTLTVSRYDLPIQEGSYVFVRSDHPDKVVNTGFYYAQNVVENGSLTTFNLSETPSGEVVELQNEPSDNIVDYICVVTKAELTNISFKCNPDLFLSDTYTFQENTDWSVNDSSEFWQVACESQETCCPEDPSLLISIGQEEAEATIVDDGVSVLEDWGMEFDREEILFADVVDDAPGEDSNFIPTSFVWVNGTQIHFVASSEDPNSSHPFITDATGELDDSTHYYAVPHVTAGNENGIKVAASYADAIADPPVVIEFIGNSTETGSFILLGSSLPPNIREILV